MKPSVNLMQVFASLQPAQEGLAHVVERHLRDYFEALDTDMPTGDLYDCVIREIERPLLTLALRRCRGNQLRAAELLGLNRNTLRKKIRELGIQTGRRHA